MEAAHIQVRSILEQEETLVTARVVIVSKLMSYHGYDVSHRLMLWIVRSLSEAKTKVRCPRPVEDWCHL